MLPVVGSLLMANIAIGVITRSAPQLNMFSFAFPVTLIIAFFAYFLFSYFRRKFFMNKSNLDSKKDQSYKNLDIKDADFEDIDND